MFYDDDDDTPLAIIYQDNVGGQKTLDAFSRQWFHDAELVCVARH